MATVPTYGDRQVRTQALQPVMQQTPDVSSGARALAQGLGQLGEAADRIDYRDAQDAAFKAEAALREDWQVQRSKLRQQYKGDQAEQYQTAADEWWAKARESYSKDLSPRAQALAGKSLAQYKLAQDADTLGYVEREKAQAREINFRTLQTTLARESLQNATPETAGAIASVTTKQLRENAIRYAAANGLSSDVGTAMAQEQIDNFHKAMALSLASRPDGLDAARSYITENSQEMLPGDRDAINRQIEQTAKQAKREREDAMSDQAWQLFAQGKTIPEQVLSQMDGRERVQLQEAARARADRAARAAAGGDARVKTDWNTYIDVRERLAAGERVDLRTLAEKIGPAQMEQLIDIQTRVAKPKTAVEVATSEQQLGAYTRQMNLKGKDLGQFQSAAYEAFNEHAQRTGKAPTYDERQKILDTLTMDVVTHKGVLWDSTDPAYKAPADVRRKALGATQPPQPVRVTTVEQARALPKGTRFIDPQGVERIR